MKNLFKVLVCLAAVFVMLLANPMEAVAQTDTLTMTAADDLSAVIVDGISPMMMFVYRTTTTLVINSSGTATATGSITGYPGITDQVWIYLYLEMNVNGTWQTYRSWSNTYSGYYGLLVGTVSVPSGFYYRVKGSYYGWSGDEYDHVIGYSGIVYR
jgi:hypothetical protein